jgi:hypothetical protein
MIENFENWNTNILAIILNFNVYLFKNQIDYKIIYLDKKFQTKNLHSWPNLITFCWIF